MSQEIINGQVVETTETDLATFVDQKKRELDMLNQQLTPILKRQAQILAELQKLIVK